MLGNQPINPMRPQAFMVHPGLVRLSIYYEIFTARLSTHPFDYTTNNRAALKNSPLLTSSTTQPLLVRVNTVPIECRGIP